MALEGSLQDMSLADLVQIFRMGPKSGILLLASGQERAVVYILEGRLIDSMVVRGSERHVVATGEEAVLHLLQWEDANFTFRHDPQVAQRKVRIVHDSEWLLIEGMRRRVNPIRLLPHQQITMRTRLELAPLPSSAESGVNLDLDQWRLLAQVSTSQDLRELCNHTGMEPEKVMRIATELVAIGLVDIVAEPPPTPQRAPAPTRRDSPQQVSQLMPALAGAAPNHGTIETAAAAPGHSLISAIMRCIRGL